MKKEKTRKKKQRKQKTNLEKMKSTENPKEIREQN